MVRSLVFALASLFIAAPALAADADEFELALSAPELKVGADGQLGVKIVVKGGYHWNEEYPAKLVFTTPTGVTLPKAELAQLKGDFKAATPQLVDVKVPATAAAAAAGEVTVEARFSICNDKVCLMKKATAKAAVVAR